MLVYRSMKLKRIILSALVLAFVGYAGVVVGYNLPKDTVANEQKSNSHIYTNGELLHAINTQREKVGSKSLSINEKLNYSASVGIRDMQENKYFSHNNPKTGKAVGLDTAISVAKEECVYVSENQNNSDTSLNPVYDGWMNSSTHKNAMLDSKYTEVGFANGAYFDGTQLYVAHFCQPR